MKNTFLKKIIVVGSIFLLFGATFFGSIQLGTKTTSTGTWFSWETPNIKAFSDDDFDALLNVLDDLDETIDDISKETEQNVAPVQQVAPIQQAAPQQTTQNSPSQKTTSTPQSVQTPTTTKTPVQTQTKNTASTVILTTQEKDNFSAFSLFFAPNGKIFTLNVDTKRGKFTTDDSPEFVSKATLIQYLLENNMAPIGHLAVAVNNISTDDNPELAHAIDIAEKQIALLTKNTKWMVYVERPFFEKK